MNTNNDKGYRRLSWLWHGFLSILMVFSSIVLAQEQIVQIHGMTYALNNGKWYMYADNRFGSEISLGRIVVRRLDRASITANDLARLGLPDVRLASPRFVNGYCVLSPPDETKSFEVAQILSQSGLFVHVLFDVYGQRNATPDDQFWGQQWNLDQTKLRMASAWDISTGNSSIIVGVIDSGCDYEHPDLTGNIWSGIGWDFVDNDNTPTDLWKHGTAVTGIIGARTNNSIGVAGVAGGWSNMKGVSLMILKDGNDEPLASLSALAVEWAADHGAHVLNISSTWVSGKPGVPELAEAINDAINNHDVVVVCIPGNTGDDQMQFPGTLDDVITVGATDQNDVRRSYSSYGFNLDVMAPSHVYTTDIRGAAGYVSGDYNSDFQGTSAAAPHVAGLVGLIRSVNPSLTWLQVHSIINNSADKVAAMGGQNWTEQYGYGRINAYQAFLFTHAYSNKSMSATATAQNFKWTNNGPYGGNITAIVIDPIDTNIVYAGTYGHGIFKSEDGGRAWKQKSNGLPVWPEPIVVSPSSPNWWFGDYYPITTIRIDPLQPSRLWVGTDGGGVAYSLNRGENWVLANAGLPDSATIRVLLQFRNNPSFLFAGTGHPSGGLFKSLDGGLHWALVDSIPHGDFYFITTIAQHPDSENVFYVGSADKLFKSSDGGNSWELLSRFLPAYDLAIDPDNPQKMWAVMTTQLFYNLLFISEDGGHQWTWYRDLPGAGGLYVDPFWNFYVPLGRPPVYKSTDRGQTWEVIATALPAAPVNFGSGPNIAVNHLNASSVYFGTFISIYHSPDGGKTVARQDKGLLNTYINALTVHPRNPSIIYAGEDWGLWKSSNAGASWVLINTEIIEAIALDPQYPDTLYWAGGSRTSTSASAMRSFDGGVSWARIANLIGGTKTAIAVRPDSTNIIFLAVYPSQLYKSTDCGQSWKLVFDEHAALWIETIVFDPTNSNMAYFGTARNEVAHGIYKTSDGGDTWSYLSDPGQVVALAMHPANSNTLYAITTEDVLISEDGGQDFRSIKGLISAQRLSDIVLDPLNPERVYLGTKDQGIFYSENAGASWQQMKGLGDPRVTSLAFFSGSSRWLYAGTHGSGVWAGEDISTAVEKPREEQGYFPEDFEMEPAYPNPFNPATTIHYQLFRDEHITLKIHTVLGKEMRTLVNKFQTVGKYTVRWNGTDAEGRKVATGVYVATMKSRNTKNKIKLLFLK